MALPKHDGLLTFLDVFIENGDIYAVSKPIKLGSVSRFMMKRRISNLTEVEIKNCALIIFNALVDLHAAGYVHGRITAENLLLLDDKNVAYTVVLRGLHNSFPTT